MVLQNGGYLYLSRSPHAYTDSNCDWLIKTIKDNRTIEIEIPKEKSCKIITIVLESRSQKIFVLSGFLPYLKLIILHCLLFNLRGNVVPPTRIAQSGRYY